MHDPTPKSDRAGGSKESEPPGSAISPLDAIAASVAIGGCAYALTLGQWETNLLALALFLVGAQYCFAKVRHGRNLRRGGVTPAEYRLLLEALEVTPAPFALFDSGNRLVVCNKAYRKLFPAAFGRTSKWRRGQPVHFDELVRSTARALLPPDQVEGYVRDRVEVHNRADGVPVDRKIHDDAWYRMVKVRTPSGGIAGVAADVTELKAREAELEAMTAEARTAEALVTTAIEMLSSGVVVYDENDQFVLCNSAMKSIYPEVAQVLTAGHSLRDYLWTGLRMGLWPEAEESEAWVERYIARLKEPDWEFVHSLKDGRSIHAYNTRSPSGLLVGLRTDITEIKRDQAELARRLSEVEVFSVFLDALPVAAYMKGTDLKILYVNKEWCRLTGFSPQDAIGHTDRDLFGEDEGEVFMGGDRRVLQTGEVDENIETLTTAAGEVRTLLARKSRVDTSQGDARLIGFSLDVTESRRNQTELETAKRRLDETLAFMDQGLAAFDAANPDDQVLEYANVRAAELLEVEPGELLIPGRAWSEVAAYFERRGDFANQALDVDRIRAWIEDPEQTEPLVVERRMPTGRHIRSVCRRRSDGGRVVTYTDITDLTVRATELERALAKATAADRAKSEFLANMSHEIRTPMNGILGMAEILAKTELSKSQAGFVDIIVKSGNALLTIINDILDFSKIEAEQVQLDPQPFVLRESIEDVAALVSARVATKHLELVVRVQPDLPASFVGDVGRFRQIVTNLVGNAIKFTDHGHVLVDVSGERQGAEGGGDTVDLLVKVEDTGSGIPADKIDRIFKKFSQVDNSSTRRHEGTGLGLAITHRLVKLMGGEIGLTSEEGVGSTFWFSLRFPVAAATEPRRRAPADLTGSRVLVVDDNEISRAILLEQMTAWRFAPETVSSGPEAIDRLSAMAARGEPFDLVIIDHDMPDMDGCETIRQIRADATVGAVPVVLLASVAGSACETGADGHLVKPARSSMLFDMVVGILHERGTRDRDSPPDGEAPPTSGETSVPDILVAEDNEINQLVIEQVLTALGHTFQIVGDGNAVIERVKDAPPRLILMDISMPGMDGIRATRAIREMEAGGMARIPIIGLTAHALDGDRERCLRHGMDDYLPKPVSPDRLREMIDRWLAAGAAERESA